MSSSTLPLVTGQVSRIRFSSEDSGFAVVVIETEKDGDVTVIGSLAGVRTGDDVRVWGERIVDPKWGDQVKATEIRVDLPATSQGVIRYLMRFEGVGEITAYRVVKQLGTDALLAILQDPGVLATVDGLTDTQREAIADGVNKESERAQVHAELLSYGLQARHVLAAFAKWREATLEVVKGNPYALEDLNGIGFVIADDVARRVGFPKGHPLRVRAGIVHTLKEAARRGHCYMQRPQLISRACRLLRLQEQRVRDEINDMDEDGRVVIDGFAVYIAGLWRAEEAVAANLLRLAVALPARDPVAEGSIPGDFTWEELIDTASLDDVQRSAVLMALSRQVSILTGGPGTGKTTITRYVVETAKAVGLRVLLCAPTGRAAKRLEQAVPGHEAATIHRLLEYHPSMAPPEGPWRRNRERPLDADLVVLDEASMVDVALMRHLLEAIPTGCRLLVVGDKDQLPSVQPGAVLRDVIASARFPSTTLERVYRQADGSSILRNAHRVNQGVMPEKSKPGAIGKDGGDYFFVQRGTPETAAPMIVQVATEDIPRAFRLDPARDIWVLSPMRRGELGVNELNRLLRDKLNPLEPGEDDRRIRVGDRVMQTKNDYTLSVFNGDWGILEAIDSSTGEHTVRLEDGAGGRVVVFDRERALRLQLAWAVTVHKFQGCEVPAVVMAMDGSQKAMLSRRLIYTAMTRARDLLTVVGDVRALEIAVSDGGGFDKERSTLLGNRIQRVFDARAKAAAPAAAPVVTAPKAEDRFGVLDIEDLEMADD